MKAIYKYLPSIFDAHSRSPARVSCGFLREKNYWLICFCFKQISLLVGWPHNI